MNKRILSILLCLMLVVSLLVMAVPVNAAPADATVTLTADKTNAKPGDEITFTVTLGPVDKIGSLEFIIDVPKGLTLGTVTGNPEAVTQVGIMKLDFQKAEHGKIQLNLRSCDVCRLLTDTYQQFTDAMEVQGKRLQLQLPVLL